MAPWGSSGGWVLTSLDLSPYADRTIHLRFYFDTGDPIANNYPGWFFDDVLVTAVGVPWLRDVPMAGQVAAGDSLEFEARFDAAGLFGGDYFADMMFATNDPDELEVHVPVYMHVTGAPDIALSDSSLAYGVVFIGAARSESFTVANVGTDVLTVTEILVENSNYSTLVPYITPLIIIYLKQKGGNLSEGILKGGACQLLCFCNYLLHAK